LISYVKQSRLDLEKMFEREKQRRQNAEAGWD
jgi:hypothetical protein